MADFYNRGGGSQVLTDLEVDGTTVVVDETNDRVGIGTDTPRTKLTVEGPVTLKEQASADGDTAAYGQLWVKTATPNELHFTTDAGDDIQITTGTSVAGAANAVSMSNGSNNRIATASGAASLNGEANLTFDGNTLNLINSSSDTNAGSFTSLDINFDKTGASTSDNTMIGLNVDMDNTTATNGTNTMVGAKLTPTLQHASAAGTTLVKGIEITATGSGPGNTTTRALDLTATGADFNQGIFMKVDDGGPDIKMLSSADTGDFCTIATGANGALTITTTDDDGANADINLVPDGEVVVTGTLQATAFRVGSDTLAEVVQDTVGAMVGSNTETGITVSYDDNDGTLDFVLDQVTSLGTITQDTVTFTSANATDPLLIIQNTTNDTDAPRLRFVKDKGAAGADADGCGEIEFYGDDDNQDNILFARIRGEVADASNGAEGGRLMLGVATHDGEFQNGLVIEDGSAEDEIDVIVGNGTDSVTTTSGYCKATNGFLVPEGKSVHIETPMLASADHSATGITALMTASENIAQGDLVYVSGNGTIGKADADAVATMPAIGLAVAAISSSNPGVVLLRGMWRDDSYNFTAGNRLFVHTDGTVTATAPSGNGDVAQAVGVALSDDVIYFSPDMTLVEITA